MTNIILSGCGGAMGQAITRLAAQRDGIEIVAGIDPTAPTLPTGCIAPYKVFPSAAECGAQATAMANVIVDFSHPSALPELLTLARRSKLPLVLATTGLSGEQIDAVRSASAEVAIFFSFNMSLGVNLMLALARMATRVLGGQFDIEIIEKHHSRKIDAPSGTAIMLADAVSAEMPQPPTFIHERKSRQVARGKNEIGMHAVRGGNIVGDHELLFAGQNETLSITHSAHSREVFASGALDAARFLRGKSPGLYDMNDLISDARN